MPFSFVPLAPSAARTVSGSGDAMDLGQISPQVAKSMPPQLRVQLDITAASGTSPTITMLIEDSIDGVNFNTIGTFAAQTAVSRNVINIGIRGDAYPAGFTWPFNTNRVRARWTIGGTTPSFTFSVKANVI